VIGYALKRLLLLVPTLLGVATVVFFLVRLVPGDPAVVFLGENATPEAVEELRRRLGLDLPWPVQLAHYLGGIASGDLGRSIFQSDAVLDIVLGRLPATLELAVASILLALVSGVAMGIVAALHRGSMGDLIVMALAQLGVSMPVFWLGILLVAFFAVELSWLPAVGRGESFVPALATALSGRPGALLDALAHLTLPALALGWSTAAVTSRLVRASLLDTLHEDYVRHARAQGIPERRVVTGHALRNALLPVVSMIGVRFGALLGGSILTESVFGWPGIGQLAVTAISQRDFPLVQGIVLVFAAMFLLLNLAVDLCYGLLDPRIRVSGAGRE
jgi:peptide/nickel transport system permease protein